MSSLRVIGAFARASAQQEVAYRVNFGISVLQSLLNLAASGSAVLVISQDLDEIFEIATSIAVMADGHMFSPQPAAEMNREKIGLLMASSGGNEGQAA